MVGVVVGVVVGVTIGRSRPNGAPGGAAPTPRADDEEISEVTVELSPVLPLSDEPLVSDVALSPEVPLPEPKSPAWHCSTGRSVTIPETLSASNACF